MLNLRLITIGKLRQSFFNEGEKEFVKRLAKYCKFECVELPAADAMDAQEKLARRKDTKTLLDYLGSKDFLILLDNRGRELTSPELAHFIENKAVGGVSRISLAIGGAQGWDVAAIDRANFTWSLSKLTFPHQMVRLLVIEQLYRAMTILRGEPYHK